MMRTAWTFWNIILDMVLSLSLLTRVLPVAYLGSNVSKQPGFTWFQRHFRHLDKLPSTHCVGAVEKMSDRPIYP